MTAASALTPRNARSSTTGGMGRSIRVAVTPSNNGNAASTSRRPATAVPTWRDRAACHNRPAQWWDDDAPNEQQQKAREACLGCPVLAQCLADASESDGGYDYGRTNIKAALTGQQRDWLYRYSRKHGPYDAEEARLIALEAKASGRKVKEIAVREGVEGVTMRLAERLLAEPAQDARVVGDRVLERMEDVLRWRDEGEALDSIAAKLGVSRRKLTQVMKAYLESDTASGRRRPHRLSDEDAVVLAARRERGVRWADMDAEEGLTPGTTLQRVCRWRRDAEKRGVPIPRGMARELRKLNQAQVVRMRERAAEGISDGEQARELGLARSFVTQVVTGKQYASYGGPIRPRKTVEARPSVSSRVLFNGGSARFAKAS